MHNTEGGGIFMSKYVVGIDLGGTKICGAIASLDGEVKCSYTIKTNAAEGEEAVLNRIFTVIDKVIEEGKVNKDDIEAIGIGSPGPLDAKKGIIVSTPNLPFKNFQLTEPVEKRYGIKTFLDNDANVAAIGEYLMGAGVGTTNMVYVTVSTGIGSGAIINGNIYRGATSNALEAGHMTIEKDGPRCNCGNYGCAEALASGTAIGRQGREKVAEGLSTSLKNYEEITSYEVFKEAASGDKVASEIIDKSLNYLGICVANIITCLDPEMVVIGGGVSKAGDIVFDKVKEVVNKRCFKAMSDNCKIVPAKLGAEVGARGACALAIMELRK